MSSCTTYCVIATRNLADVDKDGQLSCDEFAIAIHLAETAEKGVVLPKTLPVELLPGKDQHKDSPGLGNFEDRRRENFEQGRQELERRRRAIEENAAKERVSTRMTREREREGGREGGKEREEKV